MNIDTKEQFEKAVHRQFYMRTTGAPEAELRELKDEICAYMQRSWEEKRLVQ